MAELPAAEELRAARSSGRRVPDFFIVGHQKCGTTALYMMLRSNPRVFMPTVKEPWFFAAELREGEPRGGPKTPTQALAAYLALFEEASPEQLVGEATPQYIRSHTAPFQIAELQPDAKAIVVFREPASFLRSFHMQMVANHVESERDFAKAIALEPLRREGKEIPPDCPAPPALLYSDHVRYAEQLRRYQEALGQDRVLALVYDDFRRDNESVVRQVMDFLGLDQAAPVETVETKPLEAVRFMRLHRLRRDVRAARRDPASARGLARAINTLLPRRMTSGRWSKMFRALTYTSPVPPDGQAMLELRRRFKPEVESLGELLGRDLVALWGYAELDEQHPRPVTQAAGARVEPSR